MKLDLKCLFLIDSTTISLFKVILKVVENPIDGKGKGGIKVYINAQENIPMLVLYSSVIEYYNNFL